MLAARAFLFNVGFVAWTLTLGLLCLPVLAGGPAAIRRLSRLWARGVLAMLAGIVGLDHEVRGRLPDAPVLLAIKHQSAWETIALNLLVPDLAFVFKRELERVPLFGWYLARSGMVAIDRGGGMRALRALVERAQAVLADGRTVAIFPEGTRTAPGETRSYHVGIAALYEQLGVPVVPIALNSGWYWGRRAFVKHPGRIVVQVLDPIPPGLPRRDFLARLQSEIETATTALAPAAGAPDQR